VNGLKLKTPALPGMLARWTAQKFTSPAIRLLTVLVVILVGGSIYESVHAQLQQQGGSGTSVGATGAAPPGAATLAGGSVTTAAPSYTTGQMNALSLNTKGGLRVSGTEPIGTLSALDPVQVGSTDPSGYVRRFLVDGAGALYMASVGASGPQSSTINLVDGAANDPYLLAISNGAATILGYSYAFNGSKWDRIRTANTFKTATATAAGDTAVWTPTSGKKFRLMGYCIDVTNNSVLGSAGTETIALRDATTAIGITNSVFIPATALTGGAPLLHVCNSGLGNGYLSSAANNVLNVNLGTALGATGVVRVNVWGTEE
jgi:hypothetical protein